MKSVENIVSIVISGIDEVKNGLNGEKVTVENMLSAFEIFKSVLSESGVNKTDREYKDLFIGGLLKDSSYGYTDEEKKKLSEGSDALIDAIDRGFKGDFYTPPILVNTSHEYLRQYLGENFNKEYVVWDCACGTMNLTRDLEFDNLFSSTLEQGDIDTCKSMGYNEGENNSKFAYDFLNSDVDKLDRLLCRKADGYDITLEDFEDWDLYSEDKGRKLIEALYNGKKCLFFINPPYASSGSGFAKEVSKKENAHKKGVATGNRVHFYMTKYGITKCKDELYSQFIFRILMMQKLFDKSAFNIGLFAPYGYLVLSTFKTLRERLYKSMGLVGGFIFDSAIFPTVKTSWTTCFTVWRSFNDSLKTLDMLNLNEKTEKFESLGKKDIIALNDEDILNAWATEIYGYKSKDYPSFSSGLVCVGKKGRGSMCETAFGHLVLNARNVGGNTMGVFMLSACASCGKGISVTEENFDRITSAFAARRLIIGSKITWQNFYDLYCAPNENHPKWQEWLADCLIFSLFDGKSLQTSLRGVEYHSKTWSQLYWNIYNQFFFMGRNEIRALAEKYNNVDILNDLSNPDDTDERFVYKALKSGKYVLSAEGQAVLDMARELVAESFKYRDEYNARKRIVSGREVESQMNTWDAGWYQVKWILSENYKGKLDEFRGLMRVLKGKMLPLVYELGFFPGADYEESRPVFC